MSGSDACQEDRPGGRVEMSGGKPGTGRRKHQRLRAKGLSARVAVDPELDCPVEDLSHGGLFLKTDASLPLGTLVPLELRRNGRRVVTLQGWIVRAVPDPDTPPDATPGLGVVFEDLTPDVEVEIAELMATSGTADPAPPPLPLQIRRSGADLMGLPDIPPRGERPEGDPFAERPEPRMPRSGLPDEKVEFFRAVLVSKNDALNRGRVLFSQLMAEADDLHELATELRQQLSAATTQVELGRAATRELGTLQARVTQVESERLAKQSVFDAVLTSRSDLERRVAKNELELALLREGRDQADGELEKVRSEAKEAEAVVRARLRDAERAVESERDYRKEVASQLLELESTSTNLRKLRDELGLANRKAMEAQGALNKERRLREDLEARVAVADKKTAQATAESERLKGDLASLKRKLMAAEDALEAAATRSKRKPAKTS
jgi:hypothetical protein